MDHETRLAEKVCVLRVRMDWFHGGHLLRLMFYVDSSETLVRCDSDPRFRLVDRLDQPYVLLR